MSASHDLLKNIVNHLPDEVVSEMVMHLRNHLANIDDLYQAFLEYTSQLQEARTAYIYHLHERFMAGEFSPGYMAQLLDITKPDLYHLLDAMGLKVTNI